MAQVPSDPARTARELRIAIGRIARQIRRIYATADAEGDPTFLELAVLSRLERSGPTTPSALAGAEQVTAQAVGTVLGALGRRRLVARTPDPSDGRKVITTLTDTGRQVLNARTQAVTRHLIRALRDGFDSTDQEQIAAVLPLLERLANQLQQPGPG